MTSGWLLLKVCSWSYDVGTHSTALSLFIIVTVLGSLYALALSNMS